MDISIAKKIVEHHFHSFEEIPESLSLAFPTNKHNFIALLSPCVNLPDSLVVLSKVGTLSKDRYSLNELRNDSSYFDTFNLDGCKLIVAIGDNFSRNDKEFLSTLLKAAMIRLWFEKQSEIRRVTIEQTVRSRDMNSFLHRLVEAANGKFFNADEISIFTNDSIRNSLSLSATNRKIFGIQKKDIYYMLDEDTSLSRCFKSSKIIATEDSKHVYSEAWDKYFYNETIYSQLLAPIHLPNSYTSDRPLPHGVIRFSNFKHGNAVAKEYQITEYNLLATNFVCEVIFVLIQKYQQFQAHEQEVSRLTHGLGANIDAAIKFYDNCKETLFGDVRNNVEVSERRFAFRSGSFEEEEDFTNYFYDLGAFIDDLHFQFNNATSVADAEELRKDETKDFHSEVLMPLLRVAPSIAMVHNKLEPIFNNFKDAGSLRTPPLRGNSDAIVSVFRNLVDNSIKYNDNLIARINIRFDETRENFYVVYSDNGIGVPVSELERVFLEGFRTEQARLKTWTGAGIGLSYSKEIMKAMDGDLECKFSKSGATFLLRFAKNV